MPVKINPTSEIKARLGLEPNGRVQRYFQNACYRYMDKYVPRRDGNLRKNVDLTDPNYIIYKSPYAHYMYEGKVMGPNIPLKDENGNLKGFISPKGKRKTYTGEPIVYHTGGTGDHWDERMKSAEMDDLVKEVQNFIGGK